MFYIKEAFLVVCFLITTVPKSKQTSLRFGIVLVKTHQQRTFLEISVPFFIATEDLVNVWPIETCA